VVLAEGNTLIYADTYDQALAQLSSTGRAAAQAAIVQQQPAATPSPAAPQSTGTDARLESIRGHLRRYRELSSQGKWAEAGRELEAIEVEARK
jgi:uncharacterized membrane protein (UPF0182 family)